MLPSRGVALAAVACALLVGGGVACKSPPAAEPVITESGSPEEAEQEIKSLLAEAYQGVRRSNAPGMMSLAATDIFVAGPRHGDIGIERSAALVALDDAIRAKKTHKVKSVKLAVGAALDGRSAWAVDQIEFDGKGYVVVALAAELDGLWALTAVQVARAGGEAQTPASLPASWKATVQGANAAHAAASADAMKVLTQLTGEPELRVDYLDHYADRQSIVVRAAGGKKAALRGVKAIKKAWKKKPPVWTVGAPIAAATTPDGAFAWVLAPAALDDEPAGSRRVLMVLEKFEPEVVEMEGDGGDDSDDDEEPPAIQGLPWRLVVLHESVPAP
jgi:hypothetical protein